MTRAILKEDIVVKLGNQGVLLNSLPPAECGFKRLRVVNGDPIDLATLSQIWVRGLGGQNFELHAMQVVGSQLVNMTWSDRVNLISEDGAIRVRSALEIERAHKDEFNLILKNQLRQALNDTIGDEKEQIADHFKLAYLLLSFVLSGDPEIKAALEEIKASMDGLYDTTITKDRLLFVSNILKDKVPDYYADKQ